MSENLRKKITKLIRIAISLGLIIWLFSRFDLQGVWHAFERLPFSLWIGACGMLLLAQILSSFRWWIISRALKFGGAVKTYMGYYFVGMFFNLFLPTGVGGDIFKVHFLSKGIGRKLAATLTVLGDRFFGLSAMVLIGGFFVLIHPGLLPKPFDDGLVISGGTVVLILVGMPFIYNMLRRMNLKILHTLPESVLRLHKPRDPLPHSGAFFLPAGPGHGGCRPHGRRDAYYCSALLLFHGASHRQYHDHDSRYL